jgi:peptidoglycan/xylan/chitin deacetylase (PgdA/CDA1 family)
MVNKILILITFLCFFSMTIVSAEKIVLLTVDDFGAWWLESIQDSVVQLHIDNNIPVTLAVVPFGLEPEYSGIGRDKLIANIQKWSAYPNIEISQHGYDHYEVNQFQGMIYAFQYANISRGKYLFNSVGLNPLSFIPPYGSADDTTIQVLINLGFHTYYNPIDMGLTPTTNPLLLSEFLLCKDENEGPTCVFMDYDSMKNNIDQQIQQNGVALVSYHMQDFNVGTDSSQIFNTTKAAQIVDYTNRLKSAGYTLMTVEQYYQHIHNPNPGVVDNDKDGYNSSIDCNDSNKNIWQLLNGYIDNDKDGYGTGNLLQVCSGNSLPVGYSNNSMDCNDNNSEIHPGAADSTCNGIDDNCNGLVDESFSPTATNCGIGQCSSSGFLQCISGIQINSCTPKPPIAEICNNSIDDNCNGQKDEGCSRTLIIRPSGQGYRKDWTNVNCQTGTGEYRCVMYPVADSRVYLKDSGTGKETFTFSDVSLPNKTINNLTLFYYAEQNSNQSNSCFEAMTRAKSQDYLSGVQLCVNSNSSWKYVSYTYTKNPATNFPWKVSEINTLEAGMHSLDPNGGGRISQVYAVVDYI